MSWIQYWIHVLAALEDLHQDTPLTLRHGFWRQTHVDIQSSETSLLENREICEEYDMDNHYVGHVNTCHPPSFYIVVDCREGYMLILRLGDETICKACVRDMSFV